MHCICVGVYINTLYLFVLLFSFSWPEIEFVIDQVSLELLLLLIQPPEWMLGLQAYAIKSGLCLWLENCCD